MKMECQCCGYRTVRDKHDICPVCFWEQEPHIRDNNETGGANSISLNEAKSNFALYNACEPRFSKMVRAPKPEEI